MRIPIAVCHGVTLKGLSHQQAGLLLQPQRFKELVAIAADLGFKSISYDDLEGWLDGTRRLPDRPIMIDFDHGTKSMRYEVFEVLERHGFKGNLFINTCKLDDNTCETNLDPGQEHMDWEELRELVNAGWHLGAHTVTHRPLSDLSDPDLRWELDKSNQTFEEGLGFVPQDFAFPGSSWSSRAETEVKQRYRFGRLWTTCFAYTVNGETLRYAELVGADGPDEADGGPPYWARYISKDSNRYRLPAIDLQYLIHDPSAFRKYLEGASQAGVFS